MAGAEPGEGVFEGIRRGRGDRRRDHGEEEAHGRQGDGPRQPRGPLQPDGQPDRTGEEAGARPERSPGRRAGRPRRPGRRPGRPRRRPTLRSAGPAGPAAGPSCPSGDGGAGPSPEVSAIGPSAGPASLLPTTRRRKATPKAAAASCDACRRVGANWLAKTPTAMKTAAGATSATARWALSPSPKRASGTRPMARTMAAVDAHSATSPSPSAATAPAVARRRVVGPATSRSQRPESSSARVQRVAASSAQIEPRIVTMPRLRHAVHPGTVSRARPEPKRALRAPFPPIVPAI